MEEKEANQRFESLKTFIPLEDFKTLMGVDDREDRTARFCLVTATLSIEQYCKRKFLRQQYFETIRLTKNNLVLSLREYPVSVQIFINIHNYFFFLQ